MKQCSLHVEKDWLTWLPLRGFLVIFELIQLIKLAMVSIRRFMFSHTPRDIREMTKPPYFEYAIGESVCDRG